MCETEEKEIVDSLPDIDMNLEIIMRNVDEIIPYFKNSKNKNYGNARDVRNALESLYQIQAERTIDDFGNMEITKNDLDIYFKETKYV